jgi:NAD(P)-dependent dehydrogenase (short-subunit alcohol dehydrogenase family)
VIDSAPMKTLITGAGGFIGRTLALRLEEYGDFGTLTLLDRNLTGIAASATVVKADITDRVQMVRAVENADIVIHLAGLPGGTSEADPSASRAINLDASLNLIDVLSHSSRKVRMIYASTIAVFGAPLPMHVDDHTPPQPSMTYGTHKLMVEFALADAIRRGALEGVALRLPGVLGRAAGQSGFKSAFMSNVFSAIRDGIPIELPVAANATMWMLSALLRRGAHSQRPHPPNRLRSTNGHHPCASRQHGGSCRGDWQCDPPSHICSDVQTRTRYDGAIWAISYTEHTNGRCPWVRTRRYVRASGRQCARRYETMMDGTPANGPCADRLDRRCDGAQ